MKCLHYWVLETPNGKYARGICKKCKEIEYFQNGFEEVRRKRNGIMVKDFAISANHQTRYTQRGGNGDKKPH